LSLFIDALKHFDKLPPNRTICEIGAGIGRSVEIFAKVWSQSTILIFDIAPQLYVCNQYLSKVFPERVLDYRQCIELDPLIDPSKIAGKILILPSWKLPEWADFSIDLFWNCASFHEMEPHVVENYLKLIQKMGPLHIYINSLKQGNYWGDWSEGKGGTKKPVTEKGYEDSLKENYVLSRKFPTDYFMRIKDHFSYVFSKT
jgi:hypothetical protein